MNLTKFIIGGILFLFGIGESWRAISAPYHWIEIIVVILLTLGAGYIAYKGTKE